MAVMACKITEHATSQNCAAVTRRPCNSRRLPGCLGYGLALGQGQRSARGSRGGSEAEVTSEKRWNGGLLGFANKLKPKVDKENNFEQNSYTYSFLFCKANMFYKKLVDMIL